jgi:magnesium-transporting ATPase (P-type)
MQENRVIAAKAVPPGLTTAEAQNRLREFGPNRVEEEPRHPLRSFFAKFWAPVPWMLEATIVLEILVHKLDEAVIIGVLLLFNSILSFIQENQANRALTLLRKRLSVEARVLRDGHWQLIPAEQLVPGDVIHLRLGDLAPADARLFDGLVEADESDLTGESLPAEKSTGAIVYAGSRLKRGEASGEVTATGQHTYFGKTAELVKTAKTASHLQEIIFAIVRYLVVLDAVLVGALLVYAGFAHLPWSEVLPFALILVVASVPVALPATFTVATALGALDMSHHAVLVTRLSAIEEASAMDVLCTDKTGTITQNRLVVGQIYPIGDRSSEEVLRMAALASDAATQDPIDLSADSLRNDAGAVTELYDVFAGVFPEDKFRLVEALERQGHVVGMTGDGVNDAPALKQAEAGIAVSTATDVAKAAASVVLTETGLIGVVRAVETGRRIYQRMLTYTLNKIIKTLEIAVFLSVGVILTGTFVITPLLVVLLLFTNDFVTMSIATDRVSFSSRPDRWDVRTLMLTAGTLAGLVLILSFTVFFVGKDILHLPLRQLQTLVFLMLVFTGQGNVYLVRERNRLWYSLPSRWLILSSAADIVVVSLMATSGILMAPISWSLVSSLLVIVLIFLFLIDGVKVHVFRHFGVR